MTAEVLEIKKVEVEAEVKDMPSYNHSYICNGILRQLLPDERIEAFPELSLAIENGLTPDISVYLKKDVPPPNFFNDVIRLDIMPLIAIEVISISQNINDLLKKAEKLVSFGIKTVWTIEPYSRTTFVTTAGGTEIKYNTTVESEGIKVDFQKIFGVN